MIELSFVRGIVSKSTGRQQQQGCKRQDETMGDGNGDAHTVISYPPLRFSSEQMAGRGLSYAQRHTLNELNHESHPSHDLDRAPPRGPIQPRRRGGRLGVCYRPDANRSRRARCAAARGDRGADPARDRKSQDRPRRDRACASSTWRWRGSTSRGSSATMPRSTTLWPSFWTAGKLPARTTIGVTALALGALVEIDLVVRRP